MGCEKNGVCVLCVAHTQLVENILGFESVNLGSHGLCVCLVLLNGSLILPTISPIRVGEGVSLHDHSNINSRTGKVAAHTSEMRFSWASRRVTM